MSLRRRSQRAQAAWQTRWTRLGGFAAVGLGFLAIPRLAHVAGRLVAACAKWIAVSAALELFSVLGCVLVFALVFCARMSKRQSLGAALRALAASTVLPAGGLVGPAMGVRTARAGDPPLGVVKATLAFTMLTTAPSVIVMGYLVGSLGMALPIPAGIGTAEGGLIGALVLYGAPAGPAAGAVLLYRGISLSLPLTFGAIAWTVGPVMRLRPAGRPPSRGARAIPAPDPGGQRASVV
jgi:uncharacterized membrane protein YbhN (UPF0104 family)